MKNVKINNNGEVVKVKVFEKNDIIEKIGRTKEEWDLVNSYQKKFWQLLQDSDGFCVDGRMLWNELGKPTNEFGKWIKRKVVDRKIRQDGNKKKEIKLFANDKDYISEDKVVVREIGATRTTDYFLTVDCAKNVCLMEETESAQMLRDYFILAEKSLREYQNWVNTREPQKKGFRTMTDTIKRVYEEKYDKPPSHTEYQIESNLLNKCLTGMTAKQLQDYLEMDDRVTREHLTEKINSGLADLQRLNTSLINSDIDKKTRVKIISDTVRMNYSDIKQELEKVKDNKAS